MMKFRLTLLALFSGLLGFAQPANNDCASATAIAMGGPEICIPTLGNNFGATDTTITPGCANFGGGAVWYAVTVPSSGIAIIETSADTVITDTGMAVYTGTCDALELLECNDDGGEGLFSLIELTGLTAGSQLFIAVWEYGNDVEGTFNLCAYQPPVCPNIDPFTFDSDSTSIDYIEVVWESFSPGSTYYLEYGPQGFDAGSGTTITGVTGTDGPPVAVTGLDQFTFYDFYLYADCSGGFITDTIMATFGTAPGILTNDDCETAIQLPVNGPDNCIPTTGFNNGATDSGVLHSCANYSGGDVWYSFVAPSTGDVFIQTAANNGFTDGGLALYSGECGALVEVDCNDDGGDGLFSLIEAYGLTAGETYYCAVWEYGNDVEGAFDICVYAAPTCPTPEAFTFGTDSVTIDEIWLTWTTVNTGASYVIEYGPTDFVPGTGTTVTGIVGTDGPPAYISGLDPDTNYDYYYQGTCGPNDSTAVVGPLTFQTNALPPNNDHLCDAQELFVDAPEYMTTNSGATSQIGEMPGSCWGSDNTGSNLQTTWYSFVAPASGEVTATTDYPDTELHDTHIAIYELQGDCTDLTNLVEVGCDEDGGIEGPSGFTSTAVIDSLVPGQEYYIQVDGWTNQNGDFFIRVFEGLVGLDQVALGEFELYPNPATDQITIASDELQGDVTIEIVDMQGKVAIRERAIMQASTPRIIDVTALDAGVYLVTILSEKGYSVQRVVVE